MARHLSLARKALTCHGRVLASVFDAMAASPRREHGTRATSCLRFTFFAHNNLDEQKVATCLFGWRASRHVELIIMNGKLRKS